MDSREKIEISLASLQSRIERRIGINPHDDTLIDYLWEVQTMRYQNALRMRIPPQKSLVAELKAQDWV